MRYEKLFDGTTIPVMGFGTYTLGGGLSPDHSRDEEHVSIIQEALRLGYRHIDTAQMYGGGHCEELVGRATNTFERSELFITTKVRSSDLAYHKVHEAIDQSLEKLGTGYVDLYLIHWPNPAVPLKSTFKAFNELVRNGKVRYVGVSNFNVAQMKRAHEVSDNPIAANQVEYSVSTRAPERDGVLDHCRQENILLTAYEPLGKGRLIGNRVLKKVAERHGVSTARVALAWVLSRPGVITIPMTTKTDHMKDNLAAVDLELEPTDMDELEKAG
jgi:diketogulonate reductase-like aldo/keto reductase